VGLDLGQATDPSALVILERTLPAAPAPPLAHYACRWLQRWPLGTSYVAIAHDAADLLAKPPLAGCTLVIDATGCGRPVYDLFTELGKQRLLLAKVHGVLITAGMAVSFNDGFYHVAKVVLISTVQVALQQRRLQFASSLPDVPILLEEFRNYRVKVTPALNEVFSAREGAHDDLLLAVAIGLWWGERNKPKPSFAPYVVGGGRLQDGARVPPNVAAGGVVHTGSGGVVCKPWFPGGRTTKA
jgi:hypothetical protein